MKAIDIMNGLFKLANDRDYSHTCDTCKAGDPNTEVHKIAVSMFATPDVVRQAKAWGAELLIVHEPTYYDHMDHHSDETVECAKRKLIEESGLTLYRYHDYPHYTTPISLLPVCSRIWILMPGSNTPISLIWCGST